MNLAIYLRDHLTDPAPLVSRDLFEIGCSILDLSQNNPKLEILNTNRVEEFSNYVESVISDRKVKIAVGGYAENRVIYDKSAVFEGIERRTIHLGVDIWSKAYTPIYAPLEGKIHSFKNNTAIGDYGPTIILEHDLKKRKFYTLYGHLSEDSINGLNVGRKISKGEQFAKIGNYPSNGNWPPHLHFQIINDLEGNSGDYPGVCAASQAEKYLQNCPDPQIMMPFLNKSSIIK